MNSLFNWHLSTHLNTSRPLELIWCTFWQHMWKLLYKPRVSKQKVDMPGKGRCTQHALSQPDERFMCEGTVNCKKPWEYNAASAKKFRCLQFSGNLFQQAWGQSDEEYDRKYVEPQNSYSATWSVHHNETIEILFLQLVHELGTEWLNLDITYHSVARIKK